MPLAALGVLAAAPCCPAMNSKCGVDGAWLALQPLCTVEMTLFTYKFPLLLLYLGTPS